MEISLPQQVKTALSLLYQSGFEAYIVGGCVRDFLLKQFPKDFDITTNATPQQTLAVFQEYRTIETGLKHGTVTVVVDSLPLEITTYRVDGEYEDHRRPNFVHFTRNLAEDLARRDFTMNAIAYHPNEGFKDFYFGQHDMELKRIRCVGNPQKRFEEDALRIMRALRFSSVLGFEIEEETKRAIFEKKLLLKDISVERIAVELVKLICGNDAKRVLLEYIDVLAVVVPELLPMKDFAQNNPHHIYDVLTHCLVALENIKPKPHLRLAALFHDSGKPFVYSEDEKGTGHFYGHPDVSAQIARTVLQRLRLDNATIDKVCTLIQYHDIPIEPSRKSVKRWMNRISVDWFLDLLALKWADNLGKSPTRQEKIELYQEIERYYHQIIQERACFSMKDLQITGSDLIAIGILEGKMIGKIKQALLDLVIDEQIPNQKEILLTKAKELYNAKECTQ